MKFKLILICSLAFVFFHCGGVINGQKLISYVDTRVGTAASVVHEAGAFGSGTEEFAQTLPAVLVPNGMNFWTPQTRDTEKKCVAPYYYRDSLIQGFRNSHWIVGGCTQDYGSMTLMPVSGMLKCQPAARASRFSHEMETATPAYYSAYLEDYRIKTEMTGTSRAAIFRFTYSQDDAFLVVNPNSDEGEGFIEIDPENNEIRGYNPVHRIYQGNGKSAGFKGYFVIRFKDEFLSYGTFENETIFEGSKQIYDKKQIGGYVKIKLPRDKKVLIKVGSSFTGMDAARANLETEIPDWNFEKVCAELEKIWEKKLSTITVQTTDNTAKKKFYGSLYRASFLPHAINDADGSYPAFSTGTPIMKMKSGNYYEDFSMWDTYRALHPLLNIIAPQMNGEMMQSLALKYEQGGWMPIFPCWNSYTAAMIGDHCVATLADAYIKGVRNFDFRKAYQGACKNAFTSPENIDDYKNGMGRRALDSYLKYGYIPLEDEVLDAFHKREQVSRTLEYAFDDYALSQWADSLGETNDYKLLIKRAGNYKNVIDPSTGWARGRYADGRFIESFNPIKFQSYITEGTPSHYTWYVPQDVYGLMKAMGGRNTYIQKLDSMFSERLYWHGNEPCHQVAFMFNYAGEPWKTQKQVRHIMETQYMEAPGGLSGNDDSGQMSAWYIFASLGFYPVCPGTPYYMIASPSFEKVVVRLENGKNFTILAHGASDKNIYIQSAKLNGISYTKNYFSHQDILNGGVLEFVMEDQPNKNWGNKNEDCPPADTNISNFKSWAPTPPMGWNSWDCYGPTVKEDEVKANADYMAENLKAYGWEYIVVDIRWFVENDKAGGYNQKDPRYVLDEYGRYLPAENRFPSAADGNGFKKLADYIHSKGLKFGIHIMRGIPKEAVAKKLPVKGAKGITADQIYSTELQCTWLKDNYTILADKPGAQEYYNSIFDLYASWGVDFIKIDDLSRPYHKAEIELIRNAIDQCGRPIVLSTSPGETPQEAAVHVSSHANMWRMVDDVWDKWSDVVHLLDVAQKWYPYIAPGTWPDCDMIPLGRISIRGERGADRMTRLTPDEQYSLMTLFSIFRSPLMFGGDLPSNDKFTLSLLTNKEVLRMHRESIEVRQLFQKEGKVAITSRNALTGEVYLALFNLDNEKTQEVKVNLKELGLSDCNVVKIWSGESLGKISGELVFSLKPHESGLFKLK